LPISTSTRLPKSSNGNDWASGTRPERLYVAEGVFEAFQEKTDNSRGLKKQFASYFPDYRRDKYVLQKNSF